MRCMHEPSQKDALSVFTVSDPQSHGPPLATKKPVAICARDGHTVARARGGMLHHCSKRVLAFRFAFSGLTPAPDEHPGASSLGFLRRYNRVREAVPSEPE